MNVKALCALVAFIVAAFFSPTLTTAAGSYIALHSTIRVNVVVIVFDKSGVLDPQIIGAHLNRLLDSSLNINVTAASVTVSLNYEFNVTVARAPNIMVRGLAGRLEALYENLGVPSWVPPNYTLILGSVAWVNLSEAFDIIHYLSSRAALLGFYDYDELIAIIGDLDGYNRVYYYNSSYKYAEKGFVGFAGFRGLAGPAAFAFYDLSSIVAPWPSYPVPSFGNEVPVNLHNDPPLQFLEDPNLYTANLVYSHLMYHYVGALDERIPVSCPSSLEVLWIILDFGDPHVTKWLLVHAEEGLGEFERLVGSLAPWLRVHSSVKVVETPRELAHAYLEDSSGYLAFNYSKASRILSELAVKISKAESVPLLDQHCLGARCLWIFFVLATPKSSYFTTDEFNFTGVSGGSWAATTYPGWHDRVPRVGLPRVAAHELGHSLGLSHPFDYDDVTWWLMDEYVSVMGYMDFVPKMLHGVSIREAGALAAACIASLESRGPTSITPALLVYNLTSPEDLEGYIKMASLILSPHLTPLQQNPP